MISPKRPHIPLDPVIDRVEIENAADYRFEAYEEAGLIEGPDFRVEPIVGPIPTEAGMAKFAAWEAAQGFRPGTEEEKARVEAWVQAERALRRACRE